MAYSGTPTPPHPAWPQPGQHLFTKWMANKARPTATQWRKCVHPDCHYFEEREAPE